MKQHWTLADVLDFEFFLGRDQELIDSGDDDTLVERDRTIYLQVKEACRRDATPVDRTCLLHQWLARRRAAFLEQPGTSSILPGGLFQELTRICGFGVFFLALALGWGGAFSFLSYSGTTPVNVSFFFVLFVGSQMLLLTALLLSLLVRRFVGRQSLPVTYLLLRKGILYLAVRLGRLPPATDAHRWLAGLSGRLKQREKSYGFLFALPFFLLMQLGGIGFNLGVLAATLLKVVGTDIAFGWQSTLQLSSEAVYRLVQTIALPWSWLLPAHLAYPDPAQIKGSHMVLKDGIYHLATGDLVAWWPFLCMSVAVYGLLPRVCLLLAGWVAKRSLLHRLDWNTAVHRQLLHRMMTPRLSTEANEPGTVEDKPAAKEVKVEPPVEEIVEAPVNEQVSVLIPDELFDDATGSQLDQLIRDRLGLRIERCLRINQEGEEDQQILREIKQEKLPETDTLLLLQEAWQPPIEEFFFLLRNLREVLGEKVLFSIVLIGKPTAETIFTEVGDQDYRIWRQKIAAQGDPYLQCIRLVVQ